MNEVDRLVMLELDRVSLTYHARAKNFDHGRHLVLQDVSLKVYEGETLGIIGRNGVGKTTMLRLMAGILAPSRGEVRIRPGKAASLLTLGLGFKQELSGRDNAMLAAMLQGSTRRQAEAFRPEIKEFSELGDSFEEPVKNYSAGMRARLGFTTALMTHVDILLVDEVLSVGDASFRGKAQVAMNERVTSEQTVVFVSHMADQVKAVCDRAIWLDNGRVSLEGDSADVVDAYQAEVRGAHNEAARDQRILQQGTEEPQREETRALEKPPEKSEQQDP